MDIKEPFSVCPECGYKSEVASISRPTSMFHFFCPACGHKEQGVQDFAIPELMAPAKDVVLTITWKKTLVSPAELVALKKIDSRFNNKKPREVKSMVSFRPKWSIGPLTAGEGYEVYEEAQRLGLNATLKEVQ